MLQEINGLPKSETIKSYTEKNNTIEVTYLDGTKDVFEKKPSNLKKIITHMEKQAEALSTLYGNVKYDNASKEDMKKKKNKFLISISLLIGTIIITGLFLNPITVIITSLLSLLTAKGFYNYNDAQAKYDDVQKYGIYMTNKKALEEEYSQIINKENQIDQRLIKFAPSKEVNVNTIDSFSTEDIKVILEKIKRYHSVDEEVKIPQIESKRKTLIKR